MNDEERNYTMAIAHLEAMTHLNGVASIQMRDGQIFMFSRDFIRGLIDKLDESERDQIVVFVKKGKELSKEIT